MAAHATPLGRCPDCEATIPAGRLLIAYKRDDGSACYAECPARREVVGPARGRGDGMPEFDVDPETIRVFPMDEEYWFSHYFDRQDLFRRLSEYYNEDAYRFEIPTEEFETVREDLADEYVELDVVEDREAFCVVKNQYSEYGEILRDSIAHWERRGQRFFLMKDELAVMEAVERGAERLTDTEYVLGL